MAAPDPVAAFFRFAFAFEAGYAADDWSPIDPHVADDVVWIVDGLPTPAGRVSQGRAECLAAIASSCAAFDRRFDAREPKILDGPTALPGGAHLSWVVTYSRAGLPPFELRGEEWDFFGADGRLELHRERIHNLDDALGFVARHDARLRPQH